MMNLIRKAIFASTFSFIATSAVFADEIKKEIDEKSGLIISEGWEQVRDQCGVCHAVSMVTQNAGDEKTWRATINWMYDTQGLWNLSDTEDIIIKYLATNYSPAEFSKTNFRRRPVRPEDMPPKYKK